jgi:DNA-directed RNA polymerase specialized sigma24 family protein
MAAPHLDDRVQISPIDRHGRTISPEVLEVAHEIGARALRFAERQLGDSAIAASLLEEAAATVSRAIIVQSRNGNPRIRDLQAYLFRAFIRRVDRVKRKELRLLEYSNHFQQSPGSDPSHELELKLLVDELLTRCDNMARNMFYRRMEGFSWQEIGKVYGVSAHAAEGRFDRALKRLRKALRP